MALVTIIDGNGVEQQVTWQAQDKINDFSGALGALAVGVAPQLLQIAPANAQRAGFLFQNTSQADQVFYEDGNAVAGYIVKPESYFPPFQNYPIPTGAMYVVGTANSEAADTFTYREWQNQTT